MNIPTITMWNVAYASGYLLVVLLFISACIVAMLLVQTPYHASLPASTPVVETVRVGRLGTVDVGCLPSAWEGITGDTLSAIDPDRHDTGVVMAVSRVHLPAAAATVSYLRTVLHCQLPIQIWHAGSELLSHDSRELHALTQLQHTRDVTFHDIHAYPTFHTVGAAGYQAKVFALYCTSLRHVILMDAGVLCFQDPLHLLTSITYANTGAVMFPDFHNVSESSVGGRREFMDMQMMATNYDISTGRAEVGNWKGWSTKIGRAHV